MLDTQTWIANEGMICPLCNSTDVDEKTNERYFVDSTAEQRMRCRSCYSTWTEVYVLDHWTDVKEHEVDIM